MSDGRFARVTRWFLYLLIASIAIGAALAIFIVLAGNWGWFETRILLTAGIIAGASVCGMACGAAMARLRSPWLPGAGVALAGLAALLLIAGMWAELGSADYWRWTATAVIFAVATAHVSLLALARLTRGHQWIQVVAFGMAYLFASIIVAVIFTESPNDATIRVLAVVGILDAALTLLVPVMHFLDRRAAPAPTGAERGPAADAPVGVVAIDAEIDRLRARIADLEEARRAAVQPPA